MGSTKSTMGRKFKDRKDGKRQHKGGGEGHWPRYNKKGLHPDSHVDFQPEPK